MCGIVGLLEDAGKGKKQTLEQQTCRMATTLRHRGPDRGGVWADGNTGISLGFRRLAIIDLSKAADQPMTLDDGRYVIVYNGEIYNFKDIRLDLETEGIAFRSQSDTEVLLKACMKWGIERTVKKCIGMFAFALWDTVDCRLWLARDRLGIKPLYYGHTGNRFVFASELKPFCELSDWNRKIDREALNLFCQFNYVPAPKTIYQNIYKLEAGCFLQVTAGSQPKITQYWDLRSYYENKSLEISEQDLISAVDKSLREAVGRRLVSDVPVGALLSGGIDSTAVVTMMSQIQEKRIRTFTMGFEDNAYNEADHAKKIAQYLGTDHTEVVMHPSKALDLISDIPNIFDEPFGDSSALPSYLVSALARRDVTVALSGDGGDEVFFGYNRYQTAPKFWQKARWIPYSLRHLIGKTIQIPNARLWDRLARLLPESKRPNTFGVKAHKLGAILQQADEKGVYQALVSHWQGLQPVKNGSPPNIAEWHNTDKLGFAAEMAQQDSLTYLPDDILTKIDRVSMAVSLEVRVPMLDHDLVEMMAQVPSDLKLKNDVPKYILRQVLRQYLPNKLIERPKMGFAVPLDRWLRGPLRDWAEDLLDERRLKNGGLFEAKVVRSAWRQHLNGFGNYQEALWGILMAQAWLDRWT